MSAPPHPAASLRGPSLSPELEVGDDHPPAQSVLDKLKQQVEEVTNGRHRQVRTVEGGRREAERVGVELSDDSGR